MITMKNIIREGHPNLTKVATPVKLPLSFNDRKLLRQMLEFVKNSQDEEMVSKYKLRPAVGLAAPQINVLKRMLAAHVNDLDGTLYSLALINPEIIKKSNELIYLPGGEGCLSVDRGTDGLTPRYKDITITAHLLDYETNNVYPIELEVSGYVAIVVQHEIDHLNGILFTSKMFPSLPNAIPAFEIVQENEIEDEE